MLLGAIVNHEGCISLQSDKHPNVYYPLGGNSGIAEEFRRDFNDPISSDVGRKVHRVNGILYLE